MRKEHKTAIYFTFSLGTVPALTPMIRFIVLNTEFEQPNLVCKFNLLYMNPELLTVVPRHLKHAGDGHRACDRLDRWAETPAGTKSSH
jgi:hypothetical protein